jgi:hypothetical protein
MLLNELKKNDLYSRVSAAAEKKFGEFGLMTCSEDEMAQLVNLKELNKLAKKKHGEFGFATLDEVAARELINANPQFVKIK